MSLKLFRNIDELLTLKSAAAKQARNIQEQDLSIIKNAALLVSGSKILWVGPDKKITSKKLKELVGAKKVKEHQLKGFQVLPAFVECHTHSIFAGNRSHEFELRNQGVSYQEIAKQGGGILSTVQQTRKASQQKLLQKAQQHIDNFISQGVATVEVKSGYALDRKNEIKMLKVANNLNKARIVATYLGAHAFPKEMSRQDYRDLMLSQMLPYIAKHKLAQRVDIFIEQGYYDIAFAESYFKSAQELGLAVTVHADQLSHTGAASFAARHQAQSVDHLVQVSKSDIKKLSKSETTCVLLPGADFYLKMKYPPARQLIDQGARVAIASDFNPGSCPSQNIGLMGLLSRLEMKMSLAEVLCAYSLGAAYALGLQSVVGSLEAGKSSDFIVLDGTWRDLFYSSSPAPIVQTWSKGRRIFKKS